ncbi:oxygenase MpaB family protein [Nocardia sp. NPDC001965]
MPRKWIADRISGLDPEVDYDEIWKLMTSYRSNDFINNLHYTVTFPHFFLFESVARSVYSSGAGKILNDPDKRADDTMRKMHIWWQNGANHELTIKSIEGVNRLHAHVAKTHPEGFELNKTYLYTLCYEAAGVHRLMRRVGLPGFTEKERAASQKFWNQICAHFEVIGTGKSVSGFPETFDDIMAFMDQFESQEVPSHELGKTCTEVIIEQFADKNFPKPLHGFGRAWGLSLLPDHLVNAFGLDMPNRVAIRFFRLITAGMYLMGEKILPDPTETYLDRRKMDRSRKLRDAAAARGGAASSVTGGCPYEISTSADAVQSSGEPARPAEIGSE